MPRKGARAPRLLPRVLLRVLPLAVLALCAVWYVSHSRIHQTVHEELEQKLDREADFGARTIAARLDALLSSIRAVAASEVVVHGLIDGPSRRDHVPSVLRSFRLPGPDGAKIAFIDYRGRLIAANQEPIAASDYFIASSSVSGFYMRIDATGATFAQPVLFGGRQEGAIVVRYNQLQMRSVFAATTCAQACAVFHGDQLLSASNWTLASEQSARHAVHGVAVPGYEALRFVVAQPIAEAFATANGIDRTMIGAIILALCALVLGIVLTAYLATRPLQAFARELRAIGDAGDLTLRVRSAGVAEFDRLAATFNAMLERLQKVLVSHDRLDQENQARKRAERALRRSERCYREVIEGSVRGIFITSGDTVLFANQMFASLFGYETPKDLIGSHRLSDLFSADFCRLLHDHLESGEDAPRQGEVLIAGADGAERWYEHVSRPVDWQGRQALQCSLADITERKELEQLKSEFVSIVSHELRTPLTSVTGSLRLIQSGALGAMPEKIAPLIQIAHSNTKRLVALVNDILDVEKIEAGKMEFHVEPVEIVDLCRQALAENAFYGAKFAVTFELETELETAHVSADPDRLLQVLANLLSNAAKFSPEGGKVVLDLRAIDGLVRLAVIDQGPGIPAAKQAEIFEKFKQADSSEKRAKAGTGLGLAICQSIAEHHESEIRLTSTEGEGATFFFDLKRIAAAGDAAERAAAG